MQFWVVVDTSNESELLGQFKIADFSSKESGKRAENGERTKSGVEVGKR